MIEDALASPVELQRNFAIETGIPRAVHASKCAAANRLEDVEVSPRLRSPCRFVTGALLPMEVDKRREKL